MPKAVKKKQITPSTPIAPTPPPSPPAATPTAILIPDWPVVYPKLGIEEYSTTSGNGPLTVDKMKAIMGWETEKEFQARKTTENPHTEAAAWIFGDVFHCKNVAGEKVRCNNNANNRPFDKDWCEDLIHTIMYGQWAGPFTIPGETVNGETIRVSRYGRVLSGQHQMTAAILSDEWLQKARADLGRESADEKYPTWKDCDHVFIETIAIKGMSEDPRVLMTVDYVKPRTVADVFYTSDVFKTSTQTERKELCKMLASAVDMLWTRTEARGYKTHPEVVAFLERHRKLLDCVLHIFGENSGASNRKISATRLIPGQCAALMYLMAASGTTPEDSDGYRNMDPAPSEKGIDFSMWGRAADFWTLLAAGRAFIPVRTALGKLVDSRVNNEDNLGQGGRGPEKLAIIAKAWERWKDHPDTGGPPFGNEDLADGGQLSLAYGKLDDRGNPLPDGQIKLLDIADFQGIDCPATTASASKASRSPSTAPEPPPPTREEIERATAAALARRQSRG